MFHLVPMLQGGNKGKSRMTYTFSKFVILSNNLYCTPGQMRRDGNQYLINGLTLYPVKSQQDGGLAGGRLTYFKTF